MKNHKQILSMLSIVIGGVLSHGLSLMSSVDRGDNDGHSEMIRSQPVPSSRNPSIVKRKRVRKRFHRLRNHAEKDPQKVVSLGGISESSKAPSSPTSTYSGAFQKPASQKRHKLIESSRRNGRGPRVIDISYTDTTRSTNMNTKTNTIYKSYRETVKSKGFNSKGKGHSHGVHVPTSSSLFETCARTCSDRSSSKDYVSSNLSFKGKGKGYGNGKGKGKGHRSSRNVDENASAGKGGSINRLGIRGKGKGEVKGPSRMPRLQGSSTLTSKGNSKGLSSTTTNRLRSGKGKGKGTSTSTSTSTHIGKGINHVHYENECCQKGISFLKLRMEGLGTSTGTLSFGNNPCRVTSTNISQGKGGKGGKGRGEVAVASQPLVRFLNCNDPCLDSFESMNSCSNSSTVVYVENGSEICLARWDDGFDFESKLPLSITLTYKSNGDGDSGEEFFQMIHTSCSRPAYPPYVTEMSDLSNPSSCENSRVPFVPATATATGDFVNPTIVFSDGFSPTFQRENKMFGDNVPLFNHRFASCGCECGEDEDDEDDDEANDDFINLIPSSFTPPPPTISPTPTNSNSEKDCNDICEDWVSENCIIPADGLLPELSCSLQSLGGGRFLQDFTAASTIANMKRNMARDEAFRNEMADLLEILLEAGFFD